MGYQVRVFTDTGHSGIEAVEKKVNAFLGDLDPSAEVISVTPAMCTVGEADSEFYQSFAITVVYRTQIA